MFEKTLKTHYLLNLFIRRNPQKAGLAGFYGWCNFIIIFFLFLDFIYGTITNAVFSEHIFREVDNLGRRDIEVFFESERKKICEKHFTHVLLK